MAQAVKVLAVDDNEEALFALENLLKHYGYEVVTAGNGREAIERARDEHPDIILLDVVMPELDGYEATRILKSDPVLRYIPLLLLTSKDELEEVVYGFEQGADDYVKKPFESKELLARLNAAVRKQKLYQELLRAQETNEELKKTLHERYSFSQIIGGSARMRQVYRLIEKVAASSVPVLIHGESGTGKELVARALHFNSDRRNGPFVVQNCSAFQDHLLESELFGHVKGSFTGAVRDKPGLFQVADEGTFFLDELGEMTLPLQAKLLRVLQDGTFTPVGDTKPRKVNVRVIGATHRSLPKMIEQGTFREDLYYRLNVVTIDLPPLRERPEDIPLLIEHFLERKKERGSYILEKGTLKALLEYQWPGNIRQLENEIERLCLMAEDDRRLTPELLSPQLLVKQTSVVRTSGAHGTMKDEIEALECRLITDTLRRTKGNKSEAARELGISRSNLIAKVQQYRLEGDAE